MPTGYTARIVDGTTGRDFLLNCARAMGACVMQRDDPMDDPPKEQQASSYYSEELVKARAALERALSMGDAEWQAACDESFRQQSEARAEARARRDARRALLARVRSEIMEWQAPTFDHEGLRTFALQQIEVERDEGSWLDDPIERMTWQQYRDITRERAWRDVARLAEHANAEQRRTAERNQWIRDLYASLDAAIAKTEGK